MVGFDLDIRVELSSRGFRDLIRGSMSAVMLQTSLRYLTDTHQSFRLLDMLLSEEELAVQIAQIDGVEIDDVDLAETSQNEVLEKLASDTASAH